jgi:hypothetical protein
MLPRRIRAHPLLAYTRAAGKGFTASPYGVITRPGAGFLDSGAVPRGAEQAAKWLQIVPGEACGRGPSRDQGPSCGRTSDGSAQFRAPAFGAARLPAVQVGYRVRLLAS